jgi:hypothetical protein
MPNHLISRTSYTSAKSILTLDQVTLTLITSETAKHLFFLEKRFEESSDLNQNYSPSHIILIKLIAVGAGEHMETDAD